jgi:hypothetical protein
MVPVFVSNQQGTEVCRGISETFKTTLGFTTGKTAIDHHQRGAGLDQCGITAAATAQGSETHGQRTPPATRHTHAGNAPSFPRSRDKNA